MNPDPKMVKGVEVPPPHPKHLVLFFLMGTLFGASLFYEPKQEPVSPAVNPATAEQLDRIHDSIIQLQASKCVNVTTQGVTIYHTPNLGVSPVPAYRKPVEKGKANVREVQEATRRAEVPVRAD